MSETKQRDDRGASELQVTAIRRPAGATTLDAPHFAATSNEGHFGHWQARPPAWGRQRAWTDSPTDDLLHGEEADALAPLSRQAVAKRLADPDE